MRLVGFVWALPVIIPIWLLYVLPFWALGAIRLVKTANLVCIFAATTNKWAWWQRAWTRWAGHAVPAAIVVKYPTHRVTIIHELRHVDQWYLLGPLFPVVYLLLLAAYGYRKHPLEIDAIRHSKGG